MCEKAGPAPLNISEGLVGDARTKLFEFILNDLQQSFAQISCILKNILHCQGRILLFQIDFITELH